MPEGKVPEIVMVSTENGGTYVAGDSLPVTTTDVAPARKSSKLNDTAWASTMEMAANATKIRRRSWDGIQNCGKIASYGKFFLVDDSSRRAARLQIRAALLLSVQVREVPL